MTDAADRGSELGLGPSWLYPVKAALTRARSLAWLARGQRQPEGNGVRILFYHRVSEDRDELAVTPSRFRKQMAWLASAGYRAVNVVDAVTSRLAGMDGGERLIGLSFDDGYRDVSEHALPVLAEHGFTASVFVATAVVDGSATFTWYAVQPPVLGWDEIVDLDREGTLTFEAHSLTHRNLRTLDDETCRAEIAGSKAELEDRLGRPVEAFCYPGGVFSGRERRLVEGAGFAIATSCEPGLNFPGTDPLALRRTQIDARDGLIDVRAKVGGAHDAPLPLRSWYRRRRYSAGTGNPRSASSDR